MKRKIKEFILKRAGVWCKPVDSLYFRLGVVGDEPNGLPVIVFRGLHILGN